VVIASTKITSKWDKRARLLNIMYDESIKQGLWTSTWHPESFLPAAGACCGIASPRATRANRRHLYLIFSFLVMSKLCATYNDLYPPTDQMCGHRNP
jgi:hypothetical protein